MDETFLFSRLPRCRKRREIIPPGCVALLVVTLFGTATVAASELHGKVVAISGGDTVTVLDHDKHQHKIRLAGTPMAIQTPVTGSAMSPFLDLDASTSVEESLVGTAIFFSPVLESGTGSS